MTTRILVMRHAEKSDDPKDPDLTPAGRRRAEALATFIPQTFASPDFVFATARSKHSARPIETVEPLANALGIAIDANFADQDYGALAEVVSKDERFTGKLILVCWHHGNIPNLAHALGAPTGQYPDPWPRDVFDLILQIERSANAATTIREIIEPF
jgi:broad specificity phosphatase PhoE